jgi:hypothetical protein
MKGKLLYIVVLVLLIPLFSWAQSNYKYDHIQAFGLKVGANYFFADLQARQWDISPEMSYTAGLVYSFANKKYVGLQLELLYSSRKWKESFNGFSVNTDLQYLEIPLMTNISLGNGRMKYIINLGTYFAVNIGKNQSSDFPWEDEFYQSVKSREERKGDFGLLLGGALRYISKVGIFQLDARFVYGYQKLYNEDATDFKASNMMGGQLGIIYMMNFDKE